MRDKLTAEQYAKLWKLLGRLRKWRNVVREFGDKERQPGLRVGICFCPRQATEVFVMDYPVKVEVGRSHKYGKRHRFWGGCVCLGCGNSNSCSHLIREAK
jgi:hypothetical protein